MKKNTNFSEALCRQSFPFHLLFTESLSNYVQIHLVIIEHKCCTDNYFDDINVDNFTMQH